MIKSTSPETVAHKVLVIAKLIFVASMEEIVIVYKRSSAHPLLTHSNCDIVEVVVDIHETVGGFPVVVVTYQVEYEPLLYVPSPHWL